MAFVPEPQRRGRRIAMTPAERDAFLAEQRVCRVGTVGPGLVPHVTPLWYVWDGRALWLYSTLRSRRWSNLRRNPTVSVVVDAGEEYFELRGVELVGPAEPVGEEPRVGEPKPELEEPERLFAERYTGGRWLGYDRRHAWLRVQPEQEVSWDFRKLGGLGDAFTPR